MVLNFVILSYYNHVTGICDVTVLNRFESKELAIEFFRTNQSMFVDSNPVYFIVAEEHEDGFKDLNGDWIV